MVRPPGTFSVYQTVRLPETRERPVLVNVAAPHIVEEVRFRITGVTEVDIPGVDWADTPWVDPPSLSIRVGGLPDGERKLALIGNSTDEVNEWNHPPGPAPGSIRVITYAPSRGVVPQPVPYRLPQPRHLFNLTLSAEYLGNDGTPFPFLPIVEPPFNVWFWTTFGSLQVEMEYICPRCANAGQVLRTF